jgi:hypothetical protein
MGEMMDIDRKGGLGLTAVKNTLPLVYDKYARRGGAGGGGGVSAAKGRVARKNLADGCGWGFDPAARLISRPELLEWFLFASPATQPSRNKQS